MPSVLLLVRAALLAAALPLAAAADETPPYTGLAVKNTADIPNRCPADGFYMDLTAEQWKVHEKTPGADGDEQAVSAVLGVFNPDSPTLSHFVVKKMNYYARRGEAQAKFESAIFALQGDQREQGLRNYSYLLLYLGEFEKVVSFFGRGGRGERPKVGIIAFALAQSYARLGRYAESLPYAKKAYDLMPEKVMDARWQVMLTELGLYGDKLEEKYSRDYYDLSHVKEIFTNRDWKALPFDDVTEKSGIQRWSATGSVNFADLDGDGWDDLLLQYKVFPSRIYKNKAGKGFEEVPPVMGRDRLCNQLTEIAVDFDNDGRPDLQRQCCNYDGPGPNSLLKNLGGFRFEDVAVKDKLDFRVSGMMNAWGDFDLDGRLDVVVADHWGPVRLYRQNADGTFTDVTKKAGVITQGSPAQSGPGDNMDITDAPVETAGAVSCAFGDYDGDRYPDISCNGWDWANLFHNNGDGTFTDVTEKAGVGSGKGVKGYNAFWFDYNNDGKLDLYTGRYVVNSSDRWGFGPRCTCSNLLSKDGFSDREWENAGTIYRNNGDGTFTDMNKAGVTRFLPIGVMGANAADWNNDGYVDILQATGGPYMQQAEPYLFYENVGGTFTLKTPFALGMLWGKGHGSSFGDYDHDGNVDLILNNGGAFQGDVWPDLLLHNRGNDNHWLTLRLKGGPGTNSMAVGAQVELWAGPLHELQELAAGGRFPTTNSFYVHFGLGANARVDRLVVRWPNRAKTITELKDVPADQAIELVVDKPGYRKLWDSPRPAAAPAAALAK